MPSKKIKPIRNARNAIKEPRLTKGDITKAIKSIKEANNASGLSNYQLNGVFGIGGGDTVPMSQPYTLANSNNYVPITLDRILLTFSYMTHGIFQTAVDQPVYDGFRGGLVISSPELDPDEDIPLLHRYIRENKTMHEIVDAFRWARLYGGAGIIINTPQDILDQDGTVSALRREFMDYPDVPLSFVASDRWELTMASANLQKVKFPYNYYGQPLPEDRVIRIIGKEAPSFIRPQLMGWGFSELERMIRDLNAFVKANQSLFQLLDEAKIDVYRLVGFNSVILSELAQGKVNKRLAYANWLKNYHNAIIMDQEDEFQQRVQTFTGFAEVMQQIRLGICAALRMPMAKVFGISAAGLGAGEDDLENYNAMIESEIREPALPICHDIIAMSCRQLFGFEPELTIEFKPLRVLSAVEEEEVKTSKQNRVMQLYDKRLINPQEASDILKKEGLQTMDTLVLKGADPEPAMLEEGDEESGADPKTKKTQKANS